MTTSLDRYLNDKFLGLKLESPLFYNADVGIRFEIGDPDPLVSDEKYREQVLYRTTQLFKETHSESDEIFIVLFLSFRRKSKPYKIKFFKKGVKSNEILKKLNCNSITISDEEEDGWVRFRYVLSCKTSDIKPAMFLFAYHRIFFVNTTRNTIFYLYDDRGLDIASNTTAPLQELYINYNHWILDYDRESIDSIFKS
ncbi:hypothetical protein BK120_26855 [Paenibacillus sp. FSL A5-0031]|uniref:DUF3885 domain-containing protein n=1 Tax=Paenibacillus sp. FSL A5-0031 TaxID=1920420 RepID=UPI0009701A48|nr:DUF3885 domain-containing protein [Paenibacillus sp. FSL A5-0031]OME77153.1 hypothetical protein BK120_26855 [Paenibacillus sp. FSL A5-0031]